MNKQTHCKFNLNNFLNSISSLLDNTVKKNRYNISYNSKRVSYIALRIAKLQNLEDSLISDIFSYACIYNLNLSKEYIKTFPFINEDLYGNKIINSILNIAIKIEDNLNIQNNTIINQNEISSLVDDKDIKTLINEVKFNYDLTDTYQLPFYIFNHLQDFTQELEYSKIINMTKVINDIVHTYSNTQYSNNISSKCEKICDFYAFDEKDKSRMIISANLSNLGLLYIPKELLLKKSSLNKEEFNIFKTIPYCNSVTISQIFGFDDIAKFTSTICEKLDGSGYPNNLKENNLSFKDRIMAILYIYQALEENRSYREGYNKKEIKEILQDFAIEQKLDFSIVNDITNLL